jgi:HSP20 family protein
MRYRRVTYLYAGAVPGLREALREDAWSPVRARPMASPFFRPPADVVETDDAYHVTIELPGVGEDEMEVLVHPDALVVSGRRRCRGVGGAQYHVAEIRYGPFRFDMALPGDADTSGVAATTDHGLLRLSVPKRSGGKA